VIEEIQQRARRPIRRGAAGAEIFAAAHEPVDASSHRVYLNFMAHGMGLVSHEAPRLIDYKGAYEGYDATRPMEADMVISIETKWRILSEASSSSRIRSRSPKRVAWASAIRGGAGIGRDNDSQGC
jgi:Xaa-Pro aminopeptidase